MFDSTQIYRYFIQPQDKQKKGDKQTYVHHLFDYQLLTLPQRINIHPR